MSRPVFSWCSLTAGPPAWWDLRQLGWLLQSHGPRRTVDQREPILLDWRECNRRKGWSRIECRARIAVVGVDEAVRRANLIASGFGEALHSHVDLGEMGARVARLHGLAHAMPRRIAAGPVTLDLFHRDGMVQGRWLGLHPREFSLLWRLAEERGRRLARRQLLADIWRLEIMPETNSLEVHISRLRSKLAVSGCAWLVETHPDGGYRLGTSGASPAVLLPRTACVTR